MVCLDCLLFDTVALLASSAGCRLSCRVGHLNFLVPVNCRMAYSFVVRNLRRNIGRLRRFCCIRSISCLSCEIFVFGQSRLKLYSFTNYNQCLSYNTIAFLIGNPSIEASQNSCSSGFSVAITASTHAERNLHPCDFSQEFREFSLPGIFLLQLKAQCSFIPHSFFLQFVLCFLVRQ